MGKDFYENFETAKAVYDLAMEATGLDVAAICFEENDKLNVTEYTQIAMLATEVAILKVLEEKKLNQNGDIVDFLLNCLKLAYFYPLKKTT
jgi:[acyl-carrier-protein] S-malonyltransferase